MLIHSVESATIAHLVTYPHVNMRSFSSRLTRSHSTTLHHISNSPLSKFN